MSAASTADPYARAGLGGNPFVADAAPGVPDALWIDRGIAADDGPEHPAVVQVVGDRGLGKTAHLLRWAEGAPYAHVAPGRGRTARLPLPAPGGVVAWDEVDRVPRRRLVRALRRARRRRALVLLGTHRDLVAEVRAARLPLRTLRLAPPSADEVAAWAAVRIRAAALDEHGSAPLVLPGRVARRLAARRADWRAVGDALHAWAAEAVLQREPEGVGGQLARSRTSCDFLDSMTWSTMP